MSDQTQQVEVKTAAEEREEFLSGLEKLAQFLREKPELPLPSARMIQYVYGKLEMQVCVKELGKVNKEYTEWTVNVTRSFGPITYGVYCSRETVCEKKVTGTRIVPLQPSYYSPEVPEHEEEVIEWECAPILASTEDAAE